MSLSQKTSALSDDEAEFIQKNNPINIKKSNLFIRALSYIPKYLLGKIILSSQFIRLNEKEKISSHEFLITQPKITTFDGAQLDTIEIKQQEQDEEQSYIIYFRGNAELYQETLDEILEDCRKTNCNAIAFNYRGVGNSSGLALEANNLITDGIAQVERLLVDILLSLKEEDSLL